MEKSSISKIIQAGKIASETKNFAKNLIKPGMPLLDIAEKIEQQIRDLGGELAFPVNLSINEISAHYTPSYNEKLLANGLLKVDLGVHIDGWIADTAFTIDLEGNAENKKLIDTAEESLKNALKIIKPGVSTNDIGSEIHRTCISNNLNPIVNLSGHEIDRYDLHAGITIPNINDKKDIKLNHGVYAIEPFVTSGSGRVYESSPSGIFILLNTKNIRNPFAREILTYITEEYGSLPFCTRWLVKKFGKKAVLALNQLENKKNIYQYPLLIESSKAKVAQAEETIFIKGDEVLITTETNHPK